MTLVVNVAVVVVHVVVAAVVFVVYDLVQCT